MSPTSSQSVCHRTSKASWRIFWVALVALTLSGCASRSEWVSVRTTPHNPLTQTLDLLAKDGPKPSPRTEQILRRYDLTSTFRSEPSVALQRLMEQQQQTPDGDIQYAIAELAYVAGRRAELLQKDQCLGYYSTSLLHAYRYLFDAGNTLAYNPYDPQFRGACDLYNQSLEELLRIVQKQGELRPGPCRSIVTMSHLCSFDIELHSSGWHDEDFEDVHFVSDYKLVGLQNHYHTYGLGVPLIARRRPHDGEHVAEKYYPPKLTFPLTAFLRVDFSSKRGSAPHFVLELHDPLDRQALRVAGRDVPLESDLSTPLAYFLNQPEFDVESVSTRGLFNPEGVKQLQGLYMVEPFDPQKMPVVMVHGLWSSPVTWMEMYNDLRSDPYIRQHYQFWFYLYPTGQPFWMSAAQMRSDLAEMRKSVDPQRARPALDQMVLVGHSMGGLVSRMQSVEGGEVLWQSMSDQPFERLDADDELKGRLQSAFFFDPNPSIRRVITLGTPHRGSHFANDVTGWVGRKLIRMPMQLVQGRQELLARNLDYFRPHSPLRMATSIDSLDPDSELLTQLLDAEPAPWVHYHNVVGKQNRDGFAAYFSTEGDGVVSLESASLEGLPRLESQIFVTADHMSVHRHPQSVLEVRRILQKQLTELRDFPNVTREAMMVGAEETQ